MNLTNSKDDDINDEEIYGFTNRNGSIPSLKNAAVKSTKVKRARNVEKIKTDFR